MNSRYSVKGQRFAIVRRAVAFNIFARDQLIARFVFPLQLDNAISTRRTRVEIFLCSVLINPKIIYIHMCVELAWRFTIRQFSEQIREKERTASAPSSKLYDLQFASKLFAICRVPRCLSFFSFSTTYLTLVIIILYRYNCIQVHIIFFHALYERRSHYDITTTDIQIFVRHISRAGSF